MFRYIISGIIGMTVSLVCILPPIIHFVTGPLAPFIGGIVGGLRVKSNKKGAVVIGLTIGILLSGVIFSIGMLINSLGVSLPSIISDYASKDIINTSNLVKLATLIFIYSSVLGSIGAIIAGKIKK
ncbi:MAG: hypothetical protein COC01_04105 [Bacteroidetes bacterium]|nr:hypothetical protein [Bacteroidia bacterium]PCH68272.1 MAG: hypothetical protein COC01_04105 [Bacteroidota bacterium]